MSAPRSFGDVVTSAHDQGVLVVQPRMGMSAPRQMAAGLRATKAAKAPTVGTITLDSYTRVGDDDAARDALEHGADLNGYPIVAHDAGTTQSMLDGVLDASFPVQVRHGSADPRAIFRRLAALGLDASEGGPVSYCLPYSRMPLRDSVIAWREACEVFAGREDGRHPHLETFGGCMLGQLCPPSLLVAISVLEAMFFQGCGIGEVSLSYAQQTSEEQDLEAVAALRALAAEFLRPGSWHVVIYTYMGVFPRTNEGARRMSADSARLAVRSDAARLIVKTSAEAHRIPTIEENVAALEHCATAARRAAADAGPPVPETGLLEEARTLVTAVLDARPELGDALATAFETGLLDIPFCLHPDNRGGARSYIDADGWLRWSRIGRMPLDAFRGNAAPPELTSAELLGALSYVARRCDEPGPGPGRPTLVDLPEGCR